MKVGWHRKTLADVCHVYQPETISQKQMVAGEFPVYGANGRIGWHNQFNHDEPQLILGCRGSCGTVHVSESRAWINGNAMVVQPKDGVIVASFLAYALKGGMALAKAITGTAQPQITRKSLMPLPISFPSSISEQKRIVGVLDMAYDAITVAQANAERNRQSARALFVSHLDAVFTKRGPEWAERRLGDVVIRLTNGFVGPTRDIYRASGVPYLLARHVRNNGLMFDGKTFVSDEFNQKNKKSMLKAGDVLLVQSGHIGHSAVVTKDHEGHNCHAMIVLTPIGGVITGQFLSLWFNSPAMRRKFNEIRSGSTVPHLTCGAVKELNIALPDIATQQRQVDHLQQVEEQTQRLARQYEQKQVKLSALKESLLHQAFTGRL